MSSVRRPSSGPGITCWTAGTAGRPTVRPLDRPTARPYDGPMATWSTSGPGVVRGVLLVPFVPYVGSVLGCAEDPGTGSELADE